jgi:hypothetical protein
MAGATAAVGESKGPSARKKRGPQDDRVRVKVAIPQSASKPSSGTLLKVETASVAGGKENQHGGHTDKPDDATDIK